MVLHLPIRTWIHICMLAAQVLLDQTQTHVNMKTIMLNVGPTKFADLSLGSLTNLF